MSSGSTFFDWAALAANLATAGGVFFAGFQFRSERRRSRTLFTIERMERVRQCTGPAFAIAARELAATDGNLPEKDFRAAVQLPDRAKMFEGLAEIGAFMALLESKLLDKELLVRSRSPSNLRAMILASQVYFERIGPNTERVQRWLSQLDRLSPRDQGPTSAGAAPTEAAQ